MYVLFPIAIPLYVSFFLRSLDQPFISIIMRYVRELSDIAIDVQLIPHWNTLMDLVQK